MIPSLRCLLAVALCLASVSGTLAQNPAPILQEPHTLPLWQGRAPGALGDAAEDVPTLTIYMLYAAEHDGADDRGDRGARRRLSHALHE